ncbi:MAG: serine/threonine-protein kinase, partial [Rudaea sp.]
MSEDPSRTTYSQQNTRNRLRDLFDQVLELPAVERCAWLDQHVTDSDERRALEGLLSADDARGFLDTSAVEHVARLGAEEVSLVGLIGQQIGAFRIVRPLGQGGMAAVFLGERVDADFSQRVAVKLLRRGLYSPLEQRLFTRERQVLASLEHPNIARLIDGGVTAAGIPYLVMEYVDGLPITLHAEQARLDLPQRLRLFVEVCRAVEAAHRSLIVHRDIKPSNILVGTNGAPKLLDFGIAKLLEEDTQSVTVGVYTPDYAAPEQIHGGAITTATDVFGLGVLLHELLVGLRPTGTPTRRPSLRTSEMPRKASDQSIRHFAPAQLRKQLRGDLDNIVLKSLEAEPGRRYASAGAFADDIERFLNRQPVTAHPPSRAYRAQKFIQRHRGGVAITAAFLLAIIASLGLALWQTHVARQQAARASNVRDFLVGLFDTARANLPRDQRPTPELLVQLAAKRARTDAGIDAPLRADLLRTLGTVSLSMADYKQAESLLDDAIARERKLGLAPASSEWIDTLVQRGNLLQRTNRNAQADLLMTGILPELRQQDSPAAVSGLMLYATTRLYAGHADEAVAVAHEMATKATRVLPADSLDAIKAASFAGQISVVVRHYKESVPLLEPVIERWRKLDLPRDDDFAQALNNLAVAKERIGDRAAAEALYREGIALRRRIYDGPSDELATALEKFAIFLTKQERFDEAQPLLEQALAMNRKVLGPDNYEVASTLDTLGVLENSRRQFAAAEKDLRESVRIYAAHASESGQGEDLAITRNHLALT